MNIKEQLAQEYLQGSGVEFGALTNPIQIDRTKASVKYADRLSKKDVLDLFPELADVTKSIVESDILIDLNKDAMLSLKEFGFDFIVANHIIEHLVNPIQFLKNVSDIMKSKALFFLTVPDKDFNFDHNRALTANEHLWQDYLNQETKVSDTHLKDFLLFKEKVDSPHPEIVKYFKKNRLPLSYYNGNKLPWNPFTRRRLYDFHRARSIHVHVWNRETFDIFLEWINRKLTLRFHRLDTHVPQDVKGEMIYLLQKE